MMEQLDPGEDPPPDGCCGGMTILARRPLTVLYALPVNTIRAVMRREG